MVTVEEEAVLMVPLMLLLGFCRFFFLGCWLSILCSLLCFAFGC